MELNAGATRGEYLVMAESTPEEQFSLLRQQLLLLKQLRQQDGALNSSEATGPKGRNSPKIGLASTASGVCQDADRTGTAHASPLSGELALLETPARSTQAASAPATVSPGLTNPKSQRLQLMQKTLMEHQQQLLRQREHLQQQQRLLFQRSQERNFAPHSLAQLFADLHETRQQQYQQVVPHPRQFTQDQKFDGRTKGCASRHLPGKILGEEADLPLTWRQHDVHEDSGAPACLNQEGRSCGHDWDPELHVRSRRRDDARVEAPVLKGEGQVNTNAQYSAERRRMLRDAALLDPATVLDCTLRSLRSQTRKDQAADGPQTGTSSSGSSGSKHGGGGDSRSSKGGIPHSWASVPSPCSCSPQGLCRLPASSSGKVMQVHGEPLPPANLCAGLSGRALGRHCLRVTLNARRCAIRTRRNWRALVPLFPRRSAYTPAAVLSDDDLGKYTSIGPRISALRAAPPPQEPWDPPKEPFTAPGIYFLVEGGGRIAAAWAVAVDSTGRLRRCVATLGSAEAELEEDASSTRKKRPNQQQQVSRPATEELARMVSQETGSAAAWRLQALERWYARVANEPLKAQQTRSLTPGMRRDSKMSLGVGILPGPDNTATGCHMPAALDALVCHG